MKKLLIALTLALTATHVKAGLDSFEYQVITPAITGTILATAGYYTWCAAVENFIDLTSDDTNNVYHHYPKEKYRENVWKVLRMFALGLVTPTLIIQGINCASTACTNFVELTK